MTEKSITWLDSQIENYRTVKITTLKNIETYRQGEGLMLVLCVIEPETIIPIPT